MTSIHPGDRVYRGQAVRLADLTMIEDTISDVTFGDCTLIGPAVVVLLGSTLQGSIFDGPDDGILWPISDRERLVGAIGLVNCTVVGCRFQRIGIAVPESQMATYRAGFNLD